MSKLIFDIETRGQSSKELDSSVKEYLTKNAKSDEEKEDILSKTGLLPISGEVVAIAMLNPETDQGKVYFQAPAYAKNNPNATADKSEGGVEDYTKDGIQYIIKTEKEMLKSFWEDIKHFDLLVSYNGRGFDAPFIIFRSIFHKIKPSRNLMPNRYYKNEHLDLMDQLAFYGAFRKFSLEALCQFFGIKNPKDEGVSGLIVSELFDKKEYVKIAEYCMRDVFATKDLYNRVEEYIKY